MAKGNGFHKRQERQNSSATNINYSSLTIEPKGAYKIHGNTAPLSDRSGEFISGQGYCLSKQGDKIVLIGEYKGRLWKYEGDVNNLFLSSAKGHPRIDLWYDITLVDPKNPQHAPLTKNLTKIIEAHRTVSV